MPPRKRQLSPQAEVDTALPASKKAKREVTPPPPVALPQSSGVVNDGLSDEASTISGSLSSTGLDDATKTVTDKPEQVDGVDSPEFATAEENSPKSVPAEDGSILEGVLPLRPGRMWKPELLDSSLDIALKSYPRPDDYVEDDDINWHSTRGNVAPVSFANLIKLASVDMTFLHKVLALVNHQTWKFKNRVIYNPLFADPTSFSFKTDYNSVSDGKTIAHFGLVCVVSASSISQPDGVITLAPLRQMWITLGRFLATLGGEVVIGFQTSDGDLTLSRPPFMNGGSSPTKAGRDPAPTSAPNPLVYNITSGSSDSFNISDITLRYGDFRMSEVVFATFTARKFEQDAKTLWIFTPVRFVSLSG